MTKSLISSTGIPTRGLRFKIVQKKKEMRHRNLPCLTEGSLEDFSRMISFLDFESSLDLLVLLWQWQKNKKKNDNPLNYIKMLLRLLPSSQWRNVYAQAPSLQTAYDSKSFKKRMIPFLDFESSLDLLILLWRWQKNRKKNDNPLNNIKMFCDCFLSYNEKFTLGYLHGEPLRHLIEFPFKLYFGVPLQIIINRDFAVA